MLSLDILDSIVASTSGSISMSNKTSIFRQNLAWVLNAYLRLWVVLSDRLPSLSLDQDEFIFEVCSRLLASIQTFYSSEMSSESGVACEFPPLLCDVLSSNYLIRCPSLQLKVGQCIDQFINPTARQLRWLRRLLPHLSHAMKQSTSESFHPRLQVWRLAESITIHLRTYLRFLVCT